MSDWIELGQALDNSTDEFHLCGVYEIRGIDKSGKPISIPRIGKHDKSGISYIGSTTRTFARRLSEFVNRPDNHPGGRTFRMAHKVFSKSPSFADFLLQVKIYPFPKKQVNVEESKRITRYFKEFGEVPPINLTFPERQSLWERERI